MRPILNTLLLALALVGVPSTAQVQVTERGVYTLRANAIPSDRLPNSTASTHGIEPAADRAVLNVVVLERRGGQDRTVPARIDATRQNLLGQVEPIEMRAVRENDRVSYLGTFTFGPLRNQRFTVTATPDGSSESLTVEFDERFVGGER